MAANSYHEDREGHEASEREIPNFVIFVSFVVKWKF